MRWFANIGDVHGLDITLTGCHSGIDEVGGVAVHFHGPQTVCAEQPLRVALHKGAAALGGLGSPGSFRKGQHRG